LEYAADRGNLFVPECAAAQKFARIGSFDRIGGALRDRALEVDFRYRFVGPKPGRDFIRENALLALHTAMILALEV
jgi:hypothetical protein